MSFHGKRAMAAGLAAGLLLAAVPGAASWDWTKAGAFRDLPDRAPTVERARLAVARWPDEAQLLAGKLLDELGAPDEVMPHYLTWSGHAPFATITVYADHESSNQLGILLQSVGYRVPVGKWRALNAFGHGVSYDVVFNELVACSDSQEANLLALNLADEVIQGRRSPDEARALFDKTLARSYAGKSSWYLTGLTFDPKERAKRAR